MHEHNGENTCPTCNVEATTSLRRSRRIFFIAFSALLLFIGLVFEFILEKQLLATTLFLATTVIAGYGIFREGFLQLFKGKVSINLLIAIAAIGAFLIGHGEEGAAVVLLFSIAEFLEEHAARRASKSIQSLLKLAPETATVKRDDREEVVHVHNVNIGEVIVIRPGERIALDGVVIKGISSVNQAPITGESIPVTKTVGDEVYAGSINNEGFLEVKVTKKSDEAMISKIAKLVEEARWKKSSTEKFIDKFSKYYTPSVIMLAIGIATIPPLLLGYLLNEWIYRALILLVVSCPCALAISTPIAMVSAITSAARNGVLIKGSNYIEEIRKAKVFAFDKTGTLTEGNLEVVDIVSFNKSRSDVLVKAASLELLSEHPIAKAIVKKAQDEGLKLKPIEDFTSIPGKGVKGKINGETIYIGSMKLFRELPIDPPEDVIEKLEDEGKTVILIGNEKKAIGVISVMDKIRNTAINSIHELKRNGVKTVMITGDNRKTAKTIAEKIGINEYYAELLPDGKVGIIEDLTGKYKHVAMVGDGVNDAPALAKASVGIAMGAIGSDISLETADIALMQDDISKLPYLIKLSRKTLEIVKENVIASILVKGSFAILTFPGLVTLWLAVAVGDMGLSLAVILNAMRLSLIKAK